MNPLLLIALKELPGVVDFLRSAFVKANPNAPVPTDAEVIAAYQEALTGGLAAAQEWLDAHPDPAA